MMGTTHAAFGAFAALAVLRPTTVSGCAAAVIGGAFGGTVCDVDLLKSHRPGRGRKGSGILAAAVVTALLLAADALNGGELTGALLSSGVTARQLWLAGAHIALLALGFMSSHRGFTHSILALVLFSGTLYGLFPNLGIAYGLGYTSHLALDLLNRKGLRLFFPLKRRVCLNLCTADGIVNRVLLLVGILGCALAAANLLLPGFPEFI